MRNTEEETRKLNDFTPIARERVRMIEQKLKEISNKQKINEETIKELDNLISELLILRSTFVDNLINWTKQGYLVE
tara:strand:+ start:4229 stop:4456 length:228 start_codon:yes stop_codon:yes gene_type:complete